MCASPVSISPRSSGSEVEHRLAGPRWPCYTPVGLGVVSEAVPPVPIPNTVVKRLSANDTERTTSRENRSMPGPFPFHRQQGPISNGPCVFFLATANAQLLAGVTHETGLHAWRAKLRLSRMFPTSVAARQAVRRASTGRDRARRPAHAPSRPPPQRPACSPIRGPCPPARGTVRVVRSLKSMVILITSSGLLWRAAHGSPARACWLF